MPKVPTYQPGSVQSRGIGSNQLNVNAPIEAFGGGAAVARQSQALENLAGLANQAVIEQQERANKLRTEEAENEAALKMSGLLTGEDGEPGAVSRKGKNAIGVTGEYLPKFDKSVEEISNGLSNENQKEAFLLRAQRRRTAFAEQLNRHESSEIEKYEEQTTMAGIDISRDEAVKNYNDPVMVGEALNRQRDLVMSFAKSKGFSPEQTQNVLTKSLSATHTAVVGQLLESNEDKKAKAYLDTLKGEMTGEDYARVSKAVEAGTLRVESMKTADMIAAKNLSLSQATAEVRKIEDPKLRDETMRRVKEDYQLKEQAEKDQKDQVFQTSFDKVRLSGGNLDTISPSAMTYMDADQVKALSNYASDLRSGKQNQTDPAVYSEIVTQSSVPALKDKFLQRDLTVDFGNGKLSMSDFQELTKMQANLRKGDTTESDAFATKDAIIKTTLMEAGIDASPGDNEKKAALVGKFHRALNSQAEQYKQANGKYPVGKDLQKMVDSLVQEVEVLDPNAWFDDSDTKRKFEVEATDKILKTRVTSPSKLSASQRSSIAEELKARGIAVTNQNIVDFYNLQVGK